MTNRFFNVVFPATLTLLLASHSTTLTAQYSAARSDDSHPIGSASGAQPRAAAQSDMDIRNHRSVQSEILTREGDLPTPQTTVRSEASPLNNLIDVRTDISSRGLSPTIPSPATLERQYQIQVRAGLDDHHSDTLSLRLPGESGSADGLLAKDIQKQFEQHLTSTAQYRANFNTPLVVDEEALLTHSSTPATREVLDLLGDALLGAALLGTTDDEPSRFIDHDELARLDPSRLLSTGAFGPEQVEQATILPIATSNGPLIRIPTIDGTGFVLVSGNRRVQLPDGASISTLLDKEGYKRRLFGNDDYTRHNVKGQPVDETPITLSPLPGVDGTVKVVDGLDYRECETMAAPSLCYLPVVAMVSNNRTFCTGTLIGSRWVLTASHCVCDRVPDLVTFGHRGFSPELTQDPFLRVFRTSGRIEHFDPEFCDSLQNGAPQAQLHGRGDLALIELESPVSIRGITPLATIGDERLLEPVQRLVQVGFGRSDSGPAGSKNMVPVSIASKHCAEEPLMSPFNTPIPCSFGRELVAIDKELLRDSCHGDSGGGLYVRLASGELAILAVVSRGLSGECGPGSINPLVTLRDVKDWIASIVPDLRLVDDADSIAADFSTSLLTSNAEIQQ